MPDLTPLTEIADHHRHVQASLRLYHSAANPRFAELFFGQSRSQIARTLAERLDEAVRQAALVTLARVEAALRNDYHRRREGKRSDPTSAAFRRIDRTRKGRPRLVEDILETWKDASKPENRAVIGRFKGLLPFRHWLAHGRNWNVGKGHRFQDVYVIADTLLASLPLLP